MMSAVRTGESRVHIALAVADLSRSVAFYRDLLKTDPVKLRPGYAKFETEEPRLNLSLNETPDGAGAQATHAHFGIEMKTKASVQASESRLKRAGYQVRLEEHVTCCYAVQDKFWVHDPDGHAWEFFVVTQSDAEGRPLRPIAKENEESCCAPHRSA